MQPTYLLVHGILSLTKLLVDSKSFCLSKGRARPGEYTTLHVDTVFLHLRDGISFFNEICDTCSFRLLCVGLRVVDFVQGQT